MDSTINLIINGVDQGASSVLQSVGGMLGGMGGLAVAGGALAVGAVVGIGAAALSVSSQFQQAGNMMQAQLGLTADEAEAMGAVVEGVWGNNFGGSIAEVQAAVVTVQQQMNRLGEMTESELQRATESAFALRDAFGVDVAESTNAANALIENFGLTSDQAFDFITQGMQQGLNASGDFLDSIGEYSNQYSTAGFSAEAMFSIMETGMQSGVHGTDRISDAIKEMTIILNEGTDDARAAFQEMGMDYDALAESVASGETTWADHFDTIVGGLNSIEDPIVRSQAQVGIFGTMAEDLGTAFTTGLSAATTSLEGMSGATATLNAQYNNWPSMFEGIKRQALLGLQPIGDVLLDLANQAMPLVQSAFTWFSTTLTPLLETVGAAAMTWIQGTLSPAFQEFGGFVQAAIPILQNVAGTMLTLVVPGLQQLATWGMQIAQAVMPVLSAGWQFLTDNMNVILPVLSAVGVAIAVLSSPIAIVAAAVVGLATAWANNWGNIQGITQTVTTAVSTVVNSTLTNIQGWWADHGATVIATVQAFFSTAQATATTIITAIATVITTTLTGIQSWWQAHGDSVMTLVSAYFSFVATAIQTYITIVQTVITTVLTAVQTFWAAHGDTIMAVAETAWTYIKDGVQVAVDLISGIIDAFAFAVEGDWTAFGATLRTTFENAWTAMGAAAQAAVTSIVGIVAGLISDIITNFTNTNWNAVGQGVIDGIAGAISAGAGTIAAAAQGAAQAALDAAMGLLGIHSPSTVAADLVGRPFTQGIAVGATEEAPVAARQIQRGIGGIVNELGVGGGRNRLPLAGAAGVSTPAPQQVTVYHTYHVNIEDMRAMYLFLDYLQNIGGQTALEALG